MAFELEIARKSKSRYQEKVKKYVSVIRSSDETKRKFQSVLFVCPRNTVRDLLANETKIYGKLLRVLTMQEFIAELIGASNDKTI